MSDEILIYAEKNNPNIKGVWLNGTRVFGCVSISAEVTMGNLPCATMELIDATVTYIDAPLVTEEE